MIYEAFDNVKLEVVGYYMWGDHAHLHMTNFQEGNYFEKISTNEFFGVSRVEDENGNLT